ncbi:MAG TPA: hypothetical protein VIJ63_06060 [Roseiarcus sp.]
MLGVLQVIFSQDTVAGGMGVTSQLLVFLIDVLSGAADLHPFRSVGIEGPVGVVLRLAAATPATTAAAIAVTVALTLYTFEISHSVPTCCGDRRRGVHSGAIPLA